MTWPNRVWTQDESTGLWHSHEPTVADMIRREDLESHHRETGKFPKANK